MTIVVKKVPKGLRRDCKIFIWHKNIKAILKRIAFNHNIL